MHFSQLRTRSIALFVTLSSTLGGCVLEWKALEKALESATRDPNQTAAAETGDLPPSLPTAPTSPITQISTTPTETNIRIDAASDETADFESKISDMRVALEAYRSYKKASYSTLLKISSELSEVCPTGIEQNGSEETNCEGKVDLRGLVPEYLPEIPAFRNHTLYLGLNKFNSELSIILKGKNLTDVYSVNPTGNVAHEDFVTPVSYNFTVPEGINEISAIVIGGGGGGASTDGQNSNQTGYNGGGGGGGGLRFGKKLPVYPGETLTVTSIRRQFERWYV